MHPRRHNQDVRGDPQGHDQGQQPDTTGSADEHTLRGAGTEEERPPATRPHEAGTLTLYSADTNRIR